MISFSIFELPKGKKSKDKNMFLKKYQKDFVFLEKHDNI